MESKRSKFEIAGVSTDYFKERYLNDNIKAKRYAGIIGAHKYNKYNGQSNICWEVAVLLANNGIQVKIYDRKKDKNHDLAGINGDPNIVRIASELSGSDILVVGHGDMDLKWFEDYTFNDFEYSINENVLSQMKLVKEWVKNTIDAPYKKYIVLIGSMAYDNVLNGSIPYMVGKAGLSMLVRGLAWELAPKNYNVIGVHPSNTLDTPMTDKTIEKITQFRNIDRAEAENYWGAILPKEKFLTKDEISELINFFVSGKCDYLSGSNIELRGGQR